VAKTVTTRIPVTENATKMHKPSDPSGARCRKNTRKANPQGDLLTLPVTESAMVNKVTITKGIRMRTPTHFPSW
jgi:hypothetical protein